MVGFSSGIKTTLFEGNLNKQLIVEANFGRKAFLYDIKNHKRDLLPTTPPWKKLVYKTPEPGEPLYICSSCETPLTSRSEVISRNFRGLHGRAFLVGYAEGIIQRGTFERNMTTGRHVLRDIGCETCDVKLGWKYERAYEPSERYKEGKTALGAELMRVVVSGENPAYDTAADWEEAQCRKTLDVAEPDKGWREGRVSMSRTDETFGVRTEPAGP